jgi:predicted DCC family thiol-disulfide oxidoreductase YuxK
VNNLPILLFDDRCGVCHWLVRFVLRHDAQGHFRFAALDSRIGHALRREHAVNQSVDAVVLIADRQAFVASDAVIRLFRGLGWPWRLLAATAVVPRRWRDAGYAAFAARRAAISRRFGLACTLPTIEERTRFLDQNELSAAISVS